MTKNSTTIVASTGTITLNSRDRALVRSLVARCAAEPAEAMLLDQESPEGTCQLALMLALLDEIGPVPDYVGGNVVVQHNHAEWLREQVLDELTQALTPGEWTIDGGDDLRSDIDRAAAMRLERALGIDRDAVAHGLGLVPIGHGVYGLAREAVAA